MLNLGFISLDIIIFIAIILILLGISFRSGKKPIIALIVSLYPTILFFANIPFITLKDKTTEAIAFIIIYALAIFIIQKHIHVLKIHTLTRKIIDYTLLSISFVFLIISIQINFLPSLVVIYTFSPFLTNLVNQVPYGIALIAPIIIILLTSRKDL
jgi:hypothetical protein